MGVLEAMAAGKPVVASAVGGTPDAVLEGECGFLISPGDVDALADRLLRLLRDKHLRDQFGRKARLRAEECFSCETVLGQLEELYRSLQVRPTNNAPDATLGAANQINCEV